MTFGRSFAVNLREVRKARGMSQIELGRLAGLNQSQIGHYEADSRSPSVHNLLSLAVALGCSADYLLGRTGPNEWDAGYRAGIRAARDSLNRLLED